MGVGEDKSLSLAPIRLDSELRAAFSLAEDIDATRSEVHNQLFHER